MSSPINMYSPSPIQNIQHAEPPRSMASSNNHQAGLPATASSHSGSSSHSNQREPMNGGSNEGPMPSFVTDRPGFDVFAWHTAYLSCQHYFLNRSQHDITVQALAALINIRLPYQYSHHPVTSSSRYSPAGAPGVAGFHLPYGRHSGPSHSPQGASWVSLLPYVRRLVATGFDTDGIMHGFFGDDWRQGVAQLQECERRNFLFTAKSVGWAKVKYQYDMPPDESIPFIKPLQNVKIEEIEAAEKEWSKWLAMQDWMVGPRDPDMSTAEGRGSPV